MHYNFLLLITLIISFFIFNYKFLFCSVYAIVDIETTGSHPDKNGITEIAIVLHNGKEVEGRYVTLVNPGIQIPKYISFLNRYYK